MPRRSDTEPKSTNRAAWLLQSRQMFYCGRGEPWSATSLSPCHGIKEGIYVQALSASPWQQNGVCGNDLVRIRLINGDWRQRFWGGGEAYKVSFIPPCWGRLREEKAVGGKLTFCDNFLGCETFWTPDHHWKSQGNINIFKHLRW